MTFKTHFGMDIGSSSIKIAQVEPKGDRFSLVSFGLMPLSKDIQLNQVSVDVSPVVEVVKKLVKELKLNTKSVAISLPENQIYTRIVQMPSMTDAELSSALQFQIEQFVPLPAGEITVKHTVVAQTKMEGKSLMDVLIVAAPNFLIDRYVQIVDQSGLELIAIDTELLSCARSLVGTSQDSPGAIIVNMGYQSTDIALIRSGNMIVTRSIATGGLAITRTIASELDLDPKQAEEYKKAYGLDETKLGGSVFKVVKPVLDILISEIKKVVANSQTVISESPVRRLIIVGGASLLPGLVPYIASQIQVEVETGNPFQIVDRNPDQITGLGPYVPLFTNCIGLAMKYV